MKNDFTVERAMLAPTMEALLALAQENGIVLPLENAKELYAVLHKARLGVLSDEDLDSVSGGAAATPKACPKCFKTNIRIIFKEKIFYECCDPQCAFTWNPLE